MTIYHIDDRATGANNGGPGNDAFQHHSDMSSLTAGDIVEFAAGSGPYYGALNLIWNGASGNPVIWNFNGVRLTGGTDLNGSAY